MSERKFLRDWRPPDHLVDEIDLRLDIGAAATEVTSLLRIRSNPAGAGGRELVLDGRGLELISLRLDGAPLAPGRYRLSPDQLRIADPPQQFELEVRNRVDPWHNTTLEGWYAAGDMLCTQCEAHGFSRITWFPDRPDVMARFRTTLVADPRRFPVLLSNGNPGRRRRLADGRVAVSWHDPHPKPCYLFAAVAGRLSRRRAYYRTLSGRRILIEFYCDPGSEDRVGHAIGALKRAMRWDEEHYGREYDLDRYLVVVAGAFNMGAMENKGLNIFNPRYILASKDTATDADFDAVAAVVAHEYFHNWTGNRVTCRDWFQLSLKEGLTVFREQQFMASAGRGPVQRIEEVRLLRSRQFAEDAGPLAHPVRPDSYLEMNNFYTTTVYEKGAELVRILYHLAGPEGFRRGMDLYFERHDGQAVTVEDFLQAHADASGIDTRGVLRWYGQAGTPRLVVREATRGGRWALEMSQAPPSGAKDWQPVTIPVRIAGLDASGRAQAVSAEGETAQTLVLHRRQARAALAVEPPAAPVLLAGFSAPVELDFPYRRAQLWLILLHASDAYARWDAAQRIYLEDLRALIAGGAPPRDYAQLAGLLAGAYDPAVLAELLTLPQAADLLAGFGQVDLVALQAAIDRLADAQASALADLLPAAIEGLRNGRFRHRDAGRRALRARLLALWSTIDPRGAGAAAQAIYDQADNLTDRIAALSAVNRAGGQRRQRMLADFARRHASQALVIDRWFALQAEVPDPATVDVVTRLLRDRRYDALNPNRARALLGTFGNRNPVALYAPDGRGVDLLCQQVLELDQSNPQLASRLVTPFASWRRIQGKAGGHAGRALKRLRRAVRSPDLREQLERMLAD